MMVLMLEMRLVFISTIKLVPTVTPPKIKKKVYQRSEILRVVISKAHKPDSFRENRYYGVPA